MKIKILIAYIGLVVFSSSGIGGYITKYDLTPGIPDATGTEYAKLFSPSYKVTLDKPILYMDIAVSGYADPLAGPTLYSPISEVRDVWKAGWTGKGVNTLHIDVYQPGDYSHGVTTMMIIDLIAPGATKYGIHGSNNRRTLLPTDIVKDRVGANITSRKVIDVINLSLGFNYKNYREPKDILNPNLPAHVEIAFAETELDGSAKTWRNVFNGTTPTSVLNIDVADAVIVQAAGNDETDTANDPWCYIFAADASINPRLLLVGATISDGGILYKTSLARYSNRAGDNPIIRDRFLVANGNTPYATGDVSIDGEKMSRGGGTSFAAPRVAGYAAILRHKFPNLNAENSASILLDTARYDTLACYPDCPVSVYGKGEASISRALAPVGRLR